MTCIVGLVGEDGIVYLGADSLANVGGVAHIMSTAQSKLCVVSDFVIGGAGNPRMLQLVRYAFRPPPIKGDLLAYMVTEFVDALRECAKQAGYARTEEGAEVTEDTLLVGVQGRLFKVESNYSVVESEDSYQSIGSGKEVALGALYVLDGNDDISVTEKIAWALQAAEEHSTTVRSPFVVLHTEPGLDISYAHC